MSQLYAARDDMQKDGRHRGHARQAVGRDDQTGAAALRAPARQRLEEKVKSLETTDPQKAQALRQEVLFYARRTCRHPDPAGRLRQRLPGAGRAEEDRPRDDQRLHRVATTGMSALAVAQTVARATGNQIRVMEMLQGRQRHHRQPDQRDRQRAEPARGRDHAVRQQPMLGIEKIKEMFDQTFQAMDAMDNFRSKAIDVMGQNNALIRDQLARADTYVDRTRQAQAREGLPRRCLEQTGR